MAIGTDQPSRTQLRQFGGLIGLAVPLLLGWLLPALHGHGFRWWTMAVALPALALGLLAPQTLAWPYRAWMALGHALGWLNGHLILGLIYGLVLQPIALVMRLAGHDPLRRRLGGVDSYREPVQRQSTDFTRPF
ncbi:MAG: SxtJ family membrane protein [Cyanobacteriota bacterium]|nr:SxtJ family membrane protein [Cyanobacteriota bacterium]